MDKAKTEAMRNLIVAVDAIMAPAKRSGSDSVYLKDGRYMKASVLADGLKVLQALVDKAAEQAEPVAASGDDVLMLFVEGLENAILKATKHDASISIVTLAHCQTWSPARIGEIIRAINGLLDARPATAASEDGPTLEECVAAINRNLHEGDAVWDLAVMSKDRDAEISIREARFLGNAYIAREKAAEGGA